MKLIKKTANALVCLAIIALFTSCGDPREGMIVDLSGSWEIAREDTAAPTETIFQEDKTSVVSLPGSWEEIIRNGAELDGTVWLRKSAVIPESSRGTPLSLSLGRIAVADETRFNGVKIGLTGSFPAAGSLDYHFAWQNPRIYYIPENLIRYGAENVITIRVYSHVVSGINGPMAIIDHSGSYMSRVYLSYAPIIINISSIALNVFFLLGLLILYVTRRKKVEYLYFFLLVLLTLIGDFTTLDLPFSLSGLVRFKIFLLTIVAVNFITLHTVKLFFAVKNMFINWISFALFIPLILLIIVSPDSQMLVLRAGMASLVFINLCIISATLIFFIVLSRDPRRYWYFLFVAVPIPLSVLRNTWYLTTFNFNRFPMLIFFHVPLACLIFTLYYIYDFERSRDEMNSLYSALLKKSKHFERLLKALQKTSSKPEPRDLIHEVIDYLDGNYSERYDRKELSKKFGLNEDYMGQIFKKVTGLSVSNYINVRRIDAAKELLLETDAKIIDIAYHIGFDNLTHFHRQFKKQTSLTPNEYRSLMARES